MSEVGSRKSEVRGQKSEVRSQRSVKSFFGNLRLAIKRSSINLSYTKSFGKKVTALMKKVMYLAENPKSNFL
jgi:hypothetical protein